MVRRPQWLRGSLMNVLEDKAIVGRLDTLVQLIVDAPFNISGFRTKEALWIHGIYDAIQTVERINIEEMSTAVDIGSGAGFPGLVLAILVPSVKWVLIEAREKRATYLKRMIQVLDLANSSVIGGRAEEVAEVGNNGMREAADLVTARAVGSLRVTLELSLPYLKMGGRGCFPKGRNQVQVEMEQAQDLCRLLGGEYQEVSSPYGEQEDSQIIVITKVNKTPLEFPRRSKRLGSPVPG